MFVKPTPGRSVPDPARGDALPPQGREVEPSQYWQRRIADGDVVEAAREEEAPAAVEEPAREEEAPAAVEEPARNKKKES